MKKYYFANCIVLILGIILWVIGYFNDGNRQIESLTLNKIVVARPENSDDKFQIYHLNKSFNQIEANKSKLLFNKINPDLDLKVWGKSVKIHYYSEVYQNNFGYNSNQLNKFFLKGKNLELKVK